MSESLMSREELFSSINVFFLWSFECNKMVDDCRYYRVECADGFSFSAQANAYTRCSPQISIRDMDVLHGVMYFSVELGFPCAEEELWKDYAEDATAPTETVYNYVPVGVVNAALAKHGGIVNAGFRNYVIGTFRTSFPFGEYISLEESDAVI